MSMLKPVSSVMTVQQLVAPEQADRVAPLVVLHPMVAPLTGVTPSEASAWTVTGSTAWVPTGVGGFTFPLKQDECVCGRGAAKRANWLVAV